MEKFAVITMGCVQMCSETQAIRILLGKEEMRSDTVYSADITDMSDEERKELVNEIKQRRRNRKQEKEVF